MFGKRSGEIFKVKFKNPSRIQIASLVQKLHKFSQMGWGNCIGRGLQ